MLVVSRSCFLRHSVVLLAFASDTRGLPNLAPWRLALASPAFTRSDRRMLLSPSHQFQCVLHVALKAAKEYGFADFAALTPAGRT